MSWINGIAACTATGIRHAAFVVYFTVPKTVQAAMIEPTYYFKLGPIIYYLSSRLTQRVLYLTITLV
jgi:hypothetical protein